MQEQKDEHASRRVAAKHHCRAKKIEQRKNDLMYLRCQLIQEKPQQEDHIEKCKDIPGMIAVPEDPDPRAQKYLVLHDAHKWKIGDYQDAQNSKDRPCPREHGHSA